MVSWIQWQLVVLGHLSLHLQQQQNNISYGTNHPDREVAQNGWLFLNLWPPFLTFCGNLVGSGHFIPDHHARPSQFGHLAQLQCCGYAGCAGNLILIDFLFFNDLSSSSRSEVSPRALSVSCPWFWQCKWHRVWHFADMMCSVGCVVCNVCCEACNVQCNMLTAHWFTKARFIFMVQTQFYFLQHLTLHCTMHI